jgi:hypothetical protein
MAPGVSRRYDVERSHMKGKSRKIRRGWADPVECGSAGRRGEGYVCMCCVCVCASLDPSMRDTKKEREQVLSLGGFFFIGVLFFFTIGADLKTKNALYRNRAYFSLSKTILWGPPLFFSPLEQVSIFIKSILFTLSFCYILFILLLLLLFWSPRARAPPRLLTAMWEM